MSSKFELYRDKGKKWRFRLKASNGKIVAVSEGYSTERAARAGIDSVRWNAVTAGAVVKVEK